ncbi:hypothetical protein K3495_g6461 [Podosphaera aphanis]|nr:hypothetical protein K3495_g6461 [Podosphaera aphanis]
MPKGSRPSPTTRYSSQNHLGEYPRALYRPCPHDGLAAAASAYWGGGAWYFVRGSPAQTCAVPAPPFIYGFRLETPEKY